ncbi:MAG: ribosome maturation factor RimM [Actinomycetes bacterium]
MRLVVGRVGRAHGLGGEVGVEVRTDEPEVRFAVGAQLLTNRGTWTVAARRWHSGRLLLRFTQAEDRTAAEALTGVELFVEVDESAVPEEPDAYYDHQLIGMAAEFAAGGSAGVVTDVIHLPAQDLLAIRTDDDREVLVPFVAAIVPTVDVPGRRVVIDPPGGLFDPDED